MPASPTTPAGAPCWIDLQTSDPAAVRTFYSALLGWEAAEASDEFGGYFMFLKDGVPVAGAMPGDAQAPVRDVWSVYLASPDAAKTLASGAEHGGHVVVEPMPVADLGTMGFLTDVGGAAVGVWQPDTFAGLSALAEPNTPGWFEILTRDYDATVRFYRDVFGWQVRVNGDTPEFRYTVMIDPSRPEGDDQLAGIMDASAWLPEGTPAHWSVYFAVADTVAAAARVTELGGSVLAGPEDTPYGTIATAADPNGAVFKLVGPGSEWP